jgi:hypothetical protein
VHRYLRWNSGLISNNANACEDEEARRNAFIVSGRA